MKIVYGIIWHIKIQNFGCFVLVRWSFPVYVGSS